MLRSASRTHLASVGGIVRMRTSRTRPFGSSSSIVPLAIRKGRPAARTLSLISRMIPSVSRRLIWRKSAAFWSVRSLPLTVARETIESRPRVASSASRKYSSTAGASQSSTFARLMVRRTNSMTSCTCSSGTGTITHDGIGPSLVRPSGAGAKRSEIDRIRSDGVAHETWPRNESAVWHRAAASGERHPRRRRDRTRAARRYPDGITLSVRDACCLRTRCPCRVP